MVSAAVGGCIGLALLTKAIRVAWIFSKNCRLSTPRNSCSGELSNRVINDSRFHVKNDQSSKYCGTDGAKKEKKMERGNRLFLRGF